MTTVEECDERIEVLRHRLQLKMSEAEAFRNEMNRQIRHAIALRNSLVEKESLCPSVPLPVPSALPSASVSGS
jgi:hypothetical protein